MSIIYERLIRPMLFACSARDPEDAHEAVLRLVEQAPKLLVKLLPGPPRDPKLGVDALGLRFPGPIGLAAGFDKDGRAVAVLSRLGFGFLEVGTVTGEAQAGNPRPRLRRLPSDRALLNRMGFNNAGAEELAARLSGGARPLTPLGVSLGKSKRTPLEEAPEEYARCFGLLAPLADYVAINVSSPNTPGLRSLQDKDALTAVLRALRTEQARRTHHTPLVVKLSPDLSDAALDEVLDACLAHGVEGVITTNTTVSREGLGRPLTEAGGLSGRPLLAVSLAMTARVAHLTSGRLTVIGCGGIFTADDVLRYLDAGASLVQLYTALIYEGPQLPSQLHAELSRGAMGSRKQ